MGNLKRVNTSQLKEKTKNFKEVRKTPKSLNRVRNPKAKVETQILKVKKQTLKEEESVEARMSIRSQSTSRSGRLIKTPKKFLSVEEEGEVEGKIQIRLEDVRIKDVRVILPKIPRKQVGRLLLQKEREECSGANLVRKEVEERLLAEKKKKVCSAANPLMGELDEFTEAFGDEGYDKMGSKVLENFDDKAHLGKGSAVQKLSDYWEDWESMAIVESLEGPWRVVENESYDGESFDFLKVDSVLIKSDEEDKTDLVISHDSENSESDPSSLLNCLELTLFGEENELQRSFL